ncbi:hypothetical protein LX36DRAFT_745024 [Colletotrichum falcatum]|nr:hypothetical protein LX36DRAFT_745024 [Colletotrichum falcatum]
MGFPSVIISAVKRAKTKLERTQAAPDSGQAPTPIQKTVDIADTRPETEKLTEAIDLRVGGVHVPFNVLRAAEYKDGCKAVEIYAHTPADDDNGGGGGGSGDPDATEAESGKSTRIEVSLVTEKWWKDVVGEVTYVADGNCDDGGKVIYVLFCLVDPDDEVEEGEEEYVKVRHEFESEDADPL